MTFKRTLLRLHVWLGITIGFFWALQGLTGAVLMFNRDGQTAWFAGHQQGPILPFDTIIARAGAATHAKVTHLETFGPDPALMYAYHDTPAGERVAVVDGRTGAVLDVRDLEAPLPVGGSTFPWLLRLHEALLGGDTGQLVVGSSGILLLSSILVGLWNAWPQRSWRDSFRTSLWRTPTRRLIGWHRMIGLIVVPALVVTFLCGIYLAFAPKLRPLLAEVAGYQMPFKAKPQSEAPRVAISAERAFQLARAHFPGATMVRLVLPTAKSPVYLFRLLQPDDERRWAGTSTIAIDPATGAVVNAYDSRNGPLANRFTDEIYTIHTGDLGGAPGRALMLLAGLSLPFFYVTGLTTWLWARQRKRRNRAGQAGTPAIGRLAGEGGITDQV